MCLINGLTPALRKLENDPTESMQSKPYVSPRTESPPNMNLMTATLGGGKTYDNSTIFSAHTTGIFCAYV